MNRGLHRLRVAPVILLRNWQFCEQTVSRSPAHRSRLLDRYFLPSGYVGVFTGQVLFAPGDTHVAIDGPRSAAVPISTLGGQVPADGAHLMLDIAPLGSPYELELWARPVDLAMVTRHPVVLVADPRETDREVGATVAGYRLERGTTVEILAQTSIG